MSKRYILFAADGELTGADIKELATLVERRHHGAKVIEVAGNPRAVILKTTNEAAPLLRVPQAGLTVGGKRLTSVLTSGAVGNLKRRASGAKGNGQVHE